MNEEPIEVIVKYLADGPEGPAHYVWEFECPEEGYFYVSVERPTAEMLKSIHPMYVEKRAAVRA